MRIFAGLVLSFLSLLGLAQNKDSHDWRNQLQSGATLGTVRRLFLNQSVVVTGAVVSLRGRVLLQWAVARKSSDESYASTFDDLSATYQGKPATVVAVQLNQLKRRDLRPNALGEIIAEDDVVDPYFDLVVRFDDGILAMTTAYPSILSGNIELASAASDLAAQMSKRLPLLVGKTVYAVGYSKLYKQDTTLDEMVDVGSRDFHKQLWSTEVPLLEPLTILAAKYIDSTAVVFKLKLPNGKEALFATPLSFYLKLNIDRPFAERVICTLLVEIPKTLTAREVNAIKKGTIYKGMRKSVLDYVLGFPDKQNDWGRGGKQLIYSDTYFVYLDREDRVEDWQWIPSK